MGSATADMALQLTMNGPLGDETRFGQNMATKLLVVGAMTGKLEEAYKILMLGGVNVRLSGLTRASEAAVWEGIHKMVALLFSTGQHHKGTEVVIQHTMAVSPEADRARMLQGLKFDEDGLLVDWNLTTCKISTLPGS